MPSKAQFQGDFVREALGLLECLSLGTLTSGVSAVSVVGGPGLIIPVWFDTLHRDLLNFNGVLRRELHVFKQ